MFLRDFNASVSEKCLAEFCNLNGLTCLIKKPRCFKNPDNPTCIDLIVTNQPSCFQHSKVFETGLSDLHLLTVTEFKMSFQKLQTKIINYRDYKSFDNEKFRSDIWRVNLNATDLEGFMKTLFHIFNKYAPIKRKYIRANETLFMAKDLSNKFSKSEKINLTEGNKTISNDDELCRVFNNFFSKTVDELKIPNISNYKLDNTNDPLKEALRYFENHPSITNIKSKSFDQNFTFRDTSSSELIKSIQRYSQGRTGVSLNSVQEWLVSCF